ncbi:V-type proton ATPase subunit C [Lamellibrachia satsuma]|nr:V-type proton ATPase subunit C [Lamellibrachia satsuma]
MKQNNLSTNYKFHIPDLKVGTLDVLVGLSDELGKVDTFCEGVARKVSQYLGDVLEDQRDKLSENLLANGMELANYITHFQWDMAKYPIRQTLKGIADIITKQVTQIDTDLKAKASAYNSLKGSLQTLERKATGSLLTRSVADLVKKEDFVVDSEYLTTLLVVVPRSGYRDWYARYEKLSDMVVPRSSKLLFEDSEHGLFTVTLFLKVVDEYKTHCRENKFTVRDFVYNEDEVNAGKNELTKLASDKKKQFGPLVRWLKVNFSEAFTAWIHIKALRAFVESVLRYGLPVNFQAMLLEPQKRSTKRLREVLNQLYAHLDSSNSSDSKQDMVDIPGISIGQTDYYPYIYYKINIDMVENAKL